MDTRKLAVRFAVASAILFVTLVIMQIGREHARVLDAVVVDVHLAHEDCHDQEPPLGARARYDRRCAIAASAAVTGIARRNSAAMDSRGSTAATSGRRRGCGTAECERSPHGRARRRTSVRG